MNLKQFKLLTMNIPVNTSEANEKQVIILSLPLLHNAIAEGSRIMIIKLVYRRRYAC